MRNAFEVRGPFDRALACSLPIVDRLVGQLALDLSRFARRPLIALGYGISTLAKPVIGLKPGDRVMLVSENRPEWLIADLGIMAAGCVTVPTYITNTTRELLDRTLIREEGTLQTKAGRWSVDGLRSTSSSASTAS